MKSTLNKIASTIAAAIVLAIGAMLAGLGLTAMVILAVFGLAAFMLAILAAPFMPVPETETIDADATRGEPEAA